jgi:hypothetical protein
MCSRHFFTTKPKEPEGIATNLYSSVRIFRIIKSTTVSYTMNGRAEKWKFAGKKEKRPV